MTGISFRVFSNFGVQIVRPQYVLKPPAEEKSLMEECCELWQELVLDGQVSVGKQVANNWLFGLDFVIDPEGGYVELGAGE
jgi:hypothetical protein